MPLAQPESRALCRYNRGRMPLASGTRLGPYRIEAPVGAGGMGEVYRASDTRLNRFVAIKVLPSDLATDDERRARFEREARAIASLTHPNICTLYDVGRDGDIEYLVMELLEGRTLADRLRSGPLELDELLTYARQMAAALDAAHRQGVVHRDLKPANIMLTRTGVKLLDFGVAKLREEVLAAAEGLTRTAPPLTGEGRIVGTLHYMAPEQLEGQPADARTDIFAFGVTVYEMATGRRPFEGSSQASLIGAILRAEPPPLARTQPAAPPALDRLLAVCLAKDPEDRWFSAHDVLLQLREVAPALDPAPATSRGRRREAIAWMAAAVAAALALAVAFLTREDLPAGGGELSVLSMLAPEGTRLDPGQAPQVSPDGRHVAFIASDESGTAWLYLRSRDSAEARPLAGTEDAILPFWSPTSRQIGFFAQGQLKIVSITGGSPHSLAPAPVPRGGTWNDDDVIMFVPLPPVPPHTVHASGGPATPLPVGDGLDFRWFPVFLPDGRHYLFSRIDPQNRTIGFISVGSVDSPEFKDLVQKALSGTAFAAAGHLLFRRETSLVAQPFDPLRLELSGQPVPISDNVGYNPITYQALFSVSPAGHLAYVHASPTSQLAWFDRAGGRTILGVPPGHYSSLCLTDDERRAVYDFADATGNVDLWTVQANGGTPSRLTFNPTVDFFPVCSRVSPEIIFATLREGPPNLFRQALAAPGKEAALLRSPMPKIPSDWSADGRLVVYSVLNPGTNWDIEVLPLAGGEPVTFAATTAEERNGRLSPDGKWMAYMSNESGRPEVYVQPYPPTGAKWQISKGGGLQPQWRGDGRELFYLTPSRRLVAVSLAAGGAGFEALASRELFETRATGTERVGPQYTAARDGQRFLISIATDTALPITIVQNWTAALTR